MWGKLDCEWKLLFLKVKVERVGTPTYLLPSPPFHITALLPLSEHPSIHTTHKHSHSHIHTSTHTHPYTQQNTFIHTPDSASTRLPGHNALWTAAQHCSTTADHSSNFRWSTVGVKTLQRYGTPQTYSQSYATLVLGKMKCPISVYYCQAILW
jgi:hypothetical protein